MTSRSSIKVRLVKCPKCWGLLPELPDLPVYECGGCGTMLKGNGGCGIGLKDDMPKLIQGDPACVVQVYANVISHSTKFTSPRSCEEDGENVPSDTCKKDPARKNESACDSKEKELTSSSREAILCSTGECSLDLNNGRDQNKYGDCNERSGIIKLSNGVSSSGELTCHGNEESSSGAGGNRELDENNGNGSNFISFSPENQLASRGRNSSLIAQRPLDESISSKTGNFSSNEQLEQSQKTFSHDFEHIRSRDLLETAKLVDHNFISEELSGRPIDVSNSPTARISVAYDGSLSSHDGVDDQSPDRQFHPSKRTPCESQNVAEFVSTTRRPRRDNAPVDNMMSSNSEVQHQTGKFLSMSSNEKYDLAAMECAYWDQDDLLKPTRYGIQEKKQVNSQHSWGFHPVRNWTRLEREGFPSKEPAYLKGSLASHENGSSSSHGHDEFLHCSSFYSSDKSEYPEQEKMELFRIVDELRDQLNRWYTQKGKESGRVSHGATQHKKQRPFYYNYNAPKEEVLQCYDANYPRYHPGGYGPRKIRPQHHVFSQIPFSGQAENCRQHVDHSCLHCYDQDWQCTLQLPPTVVRSNKGQCRAHRGHTCCNCYRYRPSSTHRHMDSDFPLRGRDTQINHKVNKLYLKERRQSVKRHCRPVVGRAPFIICYNCWKLLQLPADFLLPRKRCHRLRCGACSKVLKFSLHDRTHIVPYTQSATEPLPSEIDETNRLSLRKSCSTKGEPDFFKPFPILQNNADERKKPLSGFLEPMEDRKKKLALKQSQNKYKNPVEASESASPSSNEAKLEKLSLEAVMLPTVSPLHGLNGLFFTK